MAVESSIRTIEQLIPANGWYAKYRRKGKEQITYQRLAMWALIEVQEFDPEEGRSTRKITVGMLANMDPDNRPGLIECSEGQHFIGYEHLNEELDDNTYFRR